MKLTKRFLAFALIAVMLISSNIFASAATFSMVKKGDAVQVDENIAYQYYTVSSGVSERTETAVVMEFDPAEGYIPMAFSGQSGTSAKLDFQYSIATERYGYDVAGIINGSFFTMDSAGTYGNYGTLVGIVISNGKVSSAHAGYSGSVVAFGADGSMNIVNSALDYKLSINGEEIPDAMYYINKTSGSKVATNWNNGFYYYDTSCGSYCDTFSICRGYEVICQKVDNTDLVVGGTLKGEVLEVKANSYGASISGGYAEDTDKFVLFVKTSSPNAAYVKDLVAGDTVNIEVNETVEASKEIMENANSVITNVGWLVKDGVDRTQIDSTIGTHSVTYAARWTAFGQKADGSYVFFTSEGGSSGDTGRSLTLRDVAAVMIELGCVNVIRMDGGGSSAMYVKDTGNGEPGYAQASSRSVGDCILIVKKSSLVDEDIINDLEEKIAAAKIAVEKSPSEEASAIIAEAEALLATEMPIKAEVRKSYAKLSTLLSGKDNLRTLVEQAEGIEFSDYSEAVLQLIRAAHKDAVAVLENETATIDEISDSIKELTKYLSLTGTSEMLVTEGASYTATSPNRNDKYDDDGIRLTDGFKSTSDGGSTNYAGWNKAGSAIEIVVDLGEIKETNYFRAYFAGNNWGITVPASVTVYVSDDGENYTEAAVSKNASLVNGDPFTSNTWCTYTASATSKTILTGRYIKFSIVPSGIGFVWVDEVEAGISSLAVRDGIGADSFDKALEPNGSGIFTPDMGTLDSETENYKNTANVVVKWDSAQNAYIVKDVFENVGDDVRKITLAEGELLISAHAEGNTETKMDLLKALIGQKLVAYNIDLENKTIGVGGYLKFEGEGVDPDDISNASDTVSNESSSGSSGGNSTTLGMIIVFGGLAVIVAVIVVVIVLIKRRRNN